MSANNKRRRKEEDEDRVILLLDLDCFYAQCESVRLGLDSSLPLALIQWDSALAVNYPARAFGIKRGDSFQEISNKSAGKCIAIHLPILSITEGSSSSSSSSAPSSNNSSMEESYENEFCLPPQKQAEAFEREKNQLRRQSEGKASLERYRLASCRIFSVLLQALTENVGKGKFILERASIDEMYVDVTAHCYDFDTPVWSSDLLELTQKETVIVCGDSKHNTTATSATAISDDASHAALWRGSVVARGMRKQVFDTLGFTLSAGVSINKLLAKLGASYGKPDGQAVIFPEFIPDVMSATNIRSARNLGGKLGKRVCDLLIDTEESPTLGTVSRLLSLHDLCKGLESQEAAQLVFNICRGIDFEPVKETYGALIKSITASKNVPPESLKEIHKWIRLLASDVLARVDLDIQRNNRIPKRCTVHYLATDSVGSEWKEHSIRVDFPKDIDSEVKLNKLIFTVCAALEKKDLALFRRIGLSATDFEVRAAKGINTFFCTRSNNNIRQVCDHQQLPSPAVEPKSNKVSANRHRILHRVSSTANKSPIKVSFTRKPEKNMLSFFSKDLNKPSEICSRRMVDRKVQEDFFPAITKNPTSCTHKITENSSKSMEETDYEQELLQNALDPDLEYARKLQNSYDKEHKVLSGMQQHLMKNRQRCKIPSKNNIETFFAQRKNITLPEAMLNQDLKYAEKIQEDYDRENAEISSKKQDFEKNVS